MGKTTKFVLAEEGADRATNETLHIHLHKGKLEANLHAYRYIDNDTKQFIACVPSLEVSGYGETESKAMEMLKFSLDSFGNYIGSLTPDKIKQELAKLGWHMNPLFNKEFSKVSVDIEGQLQNFNAENNKVERLTLQTA